jgi:hypothetical protein
MVLSYAATMGDPHRPLTRKQTLLLLLLPLLATFVCLRLYLHLVGVRHVYPGGFLVHHLFFGILIVVPAAFLLAFELRNRLLRFWSLVALGIGSALILDEVTYLVATKGTDEDYVSRISLFGAIAFISAAVILLLAIYRWHRD